jgi:RNA polymerase sigma-70 factor (ECF subfamily)
MGCPVGRGGDRAGDGPVTAVLSFCGEASYAALGWLAPGWLLSEALSFTRDRPGRESSDEELVERARANDPDAIHAIYERYAAAVYRRFTHLLGPDPEREDLMQEVFVDLFRQLGRYRGSASLRTYVFRIVSHKACDHVRQRQRQRRTLGQAPPFATVDVLDAQEQRSTAASPEERVSHAQELALVEEALEKLAPKKRIAFLLRMVDNLSLKEIAEQVGATVFTVAQRLRHADRELHRHLERAGQGRR